MVLLPGCPCCSAGISACPTRLTCDGITTLAIRCQRPAYSGDMISDPGPYEADFGFVWSPPNSGTISGPALDETIIVDLTRPTTYTVTGTNFDATFDTVQCLVIVGGGGVSPVAWTQPWFSTSGDYLYNTTVTESVYISSSNLAYIRTSAVPAAVPEVFIRSRFYFDAFRNSQRNYLYTMPAGGSCRDASSSWPLTATGGTIAQGATYRVNWPAYEGNVFQGWIQLGLRRVMPDISVSVTAS